MKTFACSTYVKLLLPSQDCTAINETSCKAEVSSRKALIFPQWVWRGGHRVQNCLGPGCLTLVGRNYCCMKLLTKLLSNKESLSLPSGQEISRRIGMRCATYYIITYITEVSCVHKKRQILGVHHSYS